MVDEWERKFQCRQLALMHACHDYKGQAPDHQILKKAEAYEDYLFGGYHYAISQQSNGATPAPYDV